MATTNRRKKTEVKEEIKQIEVPKVLHADHLRQLEVVSRDVENARLLMSIEEQSLKNITLELELMKIKLDRQKQNLGQAASNYNNSVLAFKKLKSDMWPLYGLKLEDGLGYDPNTGEISK